MIQDPGDFAPGTGLADVRRQHTPAGSNFCEMEGCVAIEARAVAIVTRRRTWRPHHLALSRIDVVAWSHGQHVHDMRNPNMKCVVV